MSSITVTITLIYAHKGSATLARGGAYSPMVVHLLQRHWDKYLGCIFNQAIDEPNLSRSARSRWKQTLTAQDGTNEAYLSAGIIAEASVYSTHTSTVSVIVTPGYELQNI